ncbi:S-layer homology domain-containing protein [Microbacterium sp. A93]|uniref:S-layer homology domain-containing protein n=1 Tax=Microbacterium sp. A93 TaxID=3450716 RepID=UPI003F41D8C9
MNPASNPASSPSDLPPPPVDGSPPDVVVASKSRPFTTTATSRVPTRRFGAARVTAAVVLAGAVAVGPGMVLPAAATPLAGAPAALAGPAAGLAGTAGLPLLADAEGLTSVEHGYPGYFSGLSVVEDELSAEANHLTVKADFCLHPDATAEDGVGFDIMWDAPISKWEVLVGLDERYTSSVPVLDDSGETVLTADMVFSVTELPDGWGQELKTSVDLTLGAGAAGAGTCGTLELPIAAPLALADVVESQPGDPAHATDPASPTDPTDTESGEADELDESDEVDEFDPYAYTVAFVDQDGRRSSDTVRLNPTELPVREAWASGELDFTGSTHWVMLTKAGPSAALDTSVVLQDGTLCRESYDALIIDSTTLMPTNQEPDLDVSCDAGTKTFTLENRLRADRQLVISQFDPRPGAAAVTHELAADLTTDGVTERRTAQVVSAAPVGRLTGSWTAPQACPAPFADNAPGSTATYQRDIRWMQCWSITQGYANGTYRAGQSISRGESVAFLYRYNEQVGEAFPLMAPGEGDFWFEGEENPFRDLSEDHPFFEPIAWAVGQGVTAGYADSTFRPARSVTRGELAAFIYRLVDGGYSDFDDEFDNGSGEEPSAPFSDVPVDHAFAREISWLAGQDVLSGYRDGTFRPAQRISRGEVARVLTQLHEQLVQR